MRKKSQRWISGCVRRVHKPQLRFFQHEQLAGHVDQVPGHVSVEIAEVVGVRRVCSEENTPMCTR